MTANKTRCPYEVMLLELGYVEIYDGQSAQKKITEQFFVPPEERRFFVRYFQKVRNNHMTNEFAKLVYDLRTGWVEPYHFKKTPDNIKHEIKMLKAETLTKTPA